MKIFIRSMLITLTSIIFTFSGSAFSNQQDSFDSLIGDYEEVLKSFRDYREGCKNPLSPEKGDAEIFKRGVIPCSADALVSFDDRLKALEDKLEEQANNTENGG